MKNRMFKATAVALMSMMLATTVGCSTGTTSTASQGGDQLTISILHYSTEKDAEASVESKMLRESIEAWKNANPNVVVQEEAISHDVYETKLKTLIAANELPDMFVALPTFSSLLYENGQILDLKPYIDGDAEWASRYAEGALGDHTFNGKVLAAPRASIANHVVLWNEDIFKACGINEFPKNTDEFKEAVKTLRENGYIPVALGNKGKYVLASQIMPGVLFKFADDNWYENLKNFTGASFTDAAPLEAITYMDELMKIGLFNDDMNSLDPSQARPLYYQEKAAMYIEGSWIISTFISETTDDILNKTNVAIFPPATGKEDLGNQIVGGQGWGVCLNSNLEGERLDVALDFLKQMNSQESSTMLIEGGSLPVLKDVSYDESKLHPLYKEFLDMYNAHSKIVGCPEVQLSSAYMDASYNGYQELSIGMVTPEQLASQLQEVHEASK